MELDRRIIVFVFGATTGLTVHEYGPNGARVLAKLDICWMDSTKGMAWDPWWLKAMLAAIRRYADKGDIIAGAMPGADLAVLTGDPGSLLNLWPLLHYQPMLKRGYKNAVHALAPQWRGLSGLAICDDFQPVCQVYAYDVRETMAHATAIVPLCDLMTCWLSGVQGRDPVMQQSQGLAHPDAHKVFDAVHGEGLFERFQPENWPLYDEYALLECGELFIMPVTHDSVFARRGGLWTGTWVGTDLRLLHQPVAFNLSKATEGLAIEGVGHTAAVISNVAYAGKPYKALMRRLGIPDYQGAATAAITCSDRAVMLPLSQMPRDPEGEEAAAWVMKQPGVQTEWALSSFIRTVAYDCRVKLEATARFLGTSTPTEINIAGGWAENRAFILALKGQGFKANVPPHGANSTHAGLAAEALLRFWRHQGDTDVTFEQALAAIPELK